MPTAISGRPPPYWCQIRHVPSLLTMQAPTGESGTHSSPNRRQSLGDFRPAMIGPHRHSATRAEGSSVLACDTSMVNRRLASAWAALVVVPADVLERVESAGAPQAARLAVGDEDFFRITKRLHNVLHGLPTGAGTVGEADREHYERTLRSNAEGLAALVREGDIVLLHDPAGNDAWAGTLT